MSVNSTGNGEGAFPLGMAELLEQADELRVIRQGEVIEGKIVSVDQEGLLVNIGYKCEGFVPQRELRSLTPEALDQLQVGDEILVYVLQPADKEEQVILSLDRAREENSWRNLEQHLENGRSLEGRITGFNKGGAMVEVGGIQGFVPLSQLAPIPRQNGDNQDALSGRVGEQVHLQVLEVNRQRRRAILSERAVLETQRREQRKQWFQTLEEGQTHRGRVTGLCKFGAFADLGGVEGLIHISELSWGPVRFPEDVVQVGEEVEVYVLRVDRETERVSLSLRRLQTEPWETVARRYQVGQTVTGTITKLVPFGAFARLEDSVEGLVHISELSDKLIRHPNEVVKEGGEYTLKILSIEPERRRLGLSLKQADEFPGM